MLDQTSIDLANYRLDKAKGSLQTAERDISDGAFQDAANRSYYSIFHSMRAVFALERRDFKRHEPLIRAFCKDYIKTGIFPEKYSDIIGNARDARNRSDYLDFYVISKENVTAQTENARAFLESVKEYIMNRIQQEAKP
jgi:uncharacterized protein (UPF0332 family)